MVYPDTYELGQSNQAVRILCNVIHRKEGMAAERAFLPAPQFCDVMREQSVPLFSLESCAPVKEFDVVGITLSHELAATNILEVLDLADIPLHADERGETDPIVLAGGPCAYNPEPFHRFFDAIGIGEGEESIGEVLEVCRSMKRRGSTRADILRAIARVEGQYVPSLYTFLDERDSEGSEWVRPKEGVPARIGKRVYSRFAESPAWEPCIVPFAEVVHDRLNVEVLRGCTRGCRFCQAGMIYRPVRERSADNIVESVLEGLDATGYDEVSLTSLSTTDHSQISEILTRLNTAVEGKGIRVSIPSQRLDSFGVDMAGLVAGQKRGGLTFAPEAGTQRLRDVINKNVSEENLFSAIEAAFSRGWRSCKLYFMIGLPTETDEDIVGIAHLAQAAYEHARVAVAPEQKGSVRISISCALFVPKPQTPFQWDGQISIEEALRRIRLLRDSISYRAIVVNWHDPSTSLIEAVLSRGGRECAALIERAWEKGARFDAWTESFREDAWHEAASELGLDLAQKAQEEIPIGRILPWDHIDSGVDGAFLRGERASAEEGITTRDCSFDSCVGCGVCPGLDIEITVQESRNA